MVLFAHQNGCEWVPGACSAAAGHGNLSIMKWLRQHGCPWDWFTSMKTALADNLELLRWARQQQPPCPWWSHQDCQEWSRLRFGPCLLVYRAQQQAPLPARKQAQARAAATRMTYAVLSLRATLPDRIPHEVVLNILNLAFSWGCCCLSRHSDDSSKISFGFVSRLQDAGMVTSI